MEPTLRTLNLIDEGEVSHTITRETEDEAMEAMTDYISERYPWAVEKYHLEESLDYFLEAYEMQLELEFSTTQEIR